MLNNRKQPHFQKEASNQQDHWKKGRREHNKGCLHDYREGKGEETVGVSFYSMLKMKIKLNDRDDSNSIFKCGFIQMLFFKMPAGHTG